MDNSQPLIENIVRNDLTTDKIKGGADNDHLIHHRDPSLDTHASIGLVGFAGDDILEGSVPYKGQIHMFAGTGDDWLVFDLIKISGAKGTQGHHGFGGHGQDTFQFTNITENLSPMVGRLDDFDPTSDQILIEGTRIDLTDLPPNISLPDGGTINVRVIEVEHPEYSEEDLGSQHFLALGDNVFYALEGARDLQNGTSGLNGEERHFLLPDSFETLRSAETVQYENPKNYVPREFYEHREEDLNLDFAPSGSQVFAQTGSETAAHLFGGKNNSDAVSSDGAQVMQGSAGDDVIDGNTGNDTILGGDGNDLIAGGIDNDLVRGETGDDMIWGGDGEDSLQGEIGNDYIDGGRGDDLLSGGDGHDTLFGGEGNDTLVGGGGEDAINRFHFYEDGGEDTISDFKVGQDLITLQDDIDPLTVELYETQDGNTMLNYGEAGSVELLGVTLKEFQAAAEIRAEEGNSIITITTDPEEEMLQELRIENGYYGDAVPPDLEVKGVDYGDAAFTTNEAGGYPYVSEHNSDGGPEKPYVLAETTLPTIPMNDQDRDNAYETAQDIEEREREEEETDLGTCFVATAAYRDRWHPDVVYLRAFRDQWLVRRAWGRVFIAFYWRVGPIIAGPVRRNPQLARLFKILISAIVGLLRKHWV